MSNPFPAAVVGPGQQETKAGESFLRLTGVIGVFISLVLLAHVAAFVLVIPIAIGSRHIAEIAAILLSGIGVVIVSGLLSRRFDKVSTRAIGIGRDRPWVRHLLFGWIGGGALIALTWVLFGSCGFAETAVVSQQSGQLIRLGVAAILCFSTALHEEALCRGYAFQIIYRNNRIAALLIGGLVFIGMHVFNEGGTHPVALLNLFLGHLFFTASYLRTRSLWLPIGLHAGWNFAEAFVFGMPLSGRVPKGLVLNTAVEANLWTGHDFGPEGGLIVTAILLTASAAIWFLVPQSHPGVDLLSSKRAAPIIQAPGKGRAVTVAGSEPTKPKERVLAIDVLRGTAILGILPMNMQIFALHPATVFYPYAGEFTDTTNITVWTMLRILIGSKDLAVFSMLFGAGILMGEAGRSGHELGVSQSSETTRLHYRRMGVLLVIGLCHAYLIWPGDILVTYAMCGSLIYLLRNLLPVRQLFLGTAAFMIPMLGLLAAHFVLPSLSPELAKSFCGLFQPDSAAIDEFNRFYGGNWLEQMALRIPDALANQTVNVLFCMGWIAGGMMLLGMGLYKLGVLTGKRPPRTYVLMICAAAFLGLPLLVYSLVWNFSRQWRLPDGFFLGWFFRECAYPIITFGWIGVVMLVCVSKKLSWLTGLLAAAGRMALTNYLMQSVICSFVFFGHGLGYVGKVDHLGQIWITLAIWISQLVISPIWLHYFRFGPAEWLWRSLSYGRRQPMRSARIGKT